MLWPTTGEENRLMRRQLSGMGRSMKEDKPKTFEKRSMANLMLITFLHQELYKSVLCVSKVVDNSYMFTKNSDGL
ncbi:hypothetical protein L6452_23892 [Arctium lappa]|uniref:Uncharacterized protein n=1 Tax=Arctium lappa TaxID=4217 RepID=A0ACB9A8U6_ARCLA|nr:hypothetical protein L6452_23892 [Arctium lappa]